MLACLDDGARDTPALPLFAVAPDDVGELDLVAFVHDVGGRAAGAFHAHVERTGGAEGKATVGLIELHGRDTEIERHAVDFLDALGREQLGHVAEPAFDQAQPRRITLGHRLAGRDGVGIAIDRDHLAVRAVEHGARIAAGAEGAVDITAAIARPQGIDDLARQHRNVAGRGVHASSPPLSELERPRTNAAILSRSPSRRCCQRPGFHIWNLSPLPTSITPSPTSSALTNSPGSVKRPSGSMAMVRALAER